jgi:hypothetical protein
MSSTNKTTTLKLSQFVGTDKPDWLTDYNEDMKKIDAFATTAESDIVAAQAASTQAKEVANSASSAANTASTSAANAVTVANSIINGWEAIVPTSVNAKIASFTRTVRGNVPAGILSISAYYYSGDKISLSSNEILFKIPTKFCPKNSALYGSIFLKDSTANTITVSNLVVNADGSVALWSGAGTINNINELVISGFACIPV